MKSYRKALEDINHTPVCAIAKILNTVHTVFLQIGFLFEMFHFFETGIADASFKSMKNNPMLKPFLVYN